MKHLIKFENFLNESNSENKFFLLFGELVYVFSIRTWGDEFKIKYKRPDGTIDSYIGDYKDFKEDFEETNDTFELKPAPEKEETIATPVVTDTPKEDYMCDVVFYIGNVKKEVLNHNIPSKLAYALKANYSKMEQYKLGKIKVEKI